MDIVHHALIGGSGFLVAAAAGQPLVGAAFVAGSVFPDMDVFFMVGGKRAFLRNHQGITHSLVLAPLYALLLVSPLVALEGWHTSFWLAALAGIVLHVLLDWFNTFRIALLAPIVRKRFSLDAVFFIDAVALSFTGAFYLAHLYFNWPFAGWLYAIAFAAYFVLKLWLQRTVRTRLGADFVIPSALNPVAFYVLVNENSDLVGFVYNALTGTRSREQRFSRAPDDIEALAQSSDLFRDMRAITRAFHITAVEESDDGTRIEARDLAVRNFGGRFGRTELVFDPKGKLIHEVADI